MKLNSLQELYLEQLKDLYDAEHQIIKALPEMIDAATSSELKAALTEHLNVTKEQVTRLDQVFSGLGEKAKGEKCKGMDGVLKEGSDLVDHVEDDSVRDAAIIASAQRVEHYEMAGYGTARTYATLLEDEEAVSLLEQTLEEEKEADMKLTELARNINDRASSRTSGTATAGKSRTRRVA
jgi:ferritin-like metal-binding protein YciE